MTHDKSLNVIQFPQTDHWARVAKTYIHYMLNSDPRAACCYLDFQLTILKLKSPPPMLRKAIEREGKRLGFKGQIIFHPEI